MKFLILILLALAGGSYLYTKERQQEALHPSVIKNPIYAEMRFSLEVGGRVFEMLLLAKTTGEAECRSASSRLSLIKDQFEANRWKIKSTECMANLPPRYAAMFEGTPTHVTYLSITRGAPEEREIRVINWGITVEQSDKLCDALMAGVQRLKGTASCIRSAKI